VNQSPLIWRKEMTDDRPQQRTYTGSIDPEKFQKMIAVRAYYKAEKRDFATGHEVDDWLAAERELNKQYFYWFQEEW
jgi:hypothetical protein